MSSRLALTCFLIPFALLTCSSFQRLDRLLLLLDTGSTISVRTTAAKQLAQLAAKSVISDVALEDDVKAHRHHQPLGDPSGWTELMAVIARVCGIRYDTTLNAHVSFLGSPLSSF